MNSMIFCIQFSFSARVHETKKRSRSLILGRERSNTSWCHPNSAAMRPFQLLLRGARRGCFHPRSHAVLARSAAVRFQPAAHLSAGGVVRVTPARSTRSILILGDFSPVVKEGRGIYAVNGLLLGFTISRQSKSPRSSPSTSISAVARLLAKGMLFWSHRREI